MGNRGPLRQSVDLKVLRGSYREDRDGPAAVGAPLPVQDFGDATPPAELGEAGKRAWEETTDLLIPSRVLTAADRPSLLTYCVNHDRRAMYEALLQAEGEFQLLKNGCRVAHPAVKLRQQAEKWIADFQRQFGMTALARERINVKPLQGESALTRFKREGAVSSRDRHAVYLTEEERDSLTETAFLDPNASRDDQALALDLLSQSEPQNEAS